MYVGSNHTGVTWLEGVIQAELRTAVDILVQGGAAAPSGAD